ncbi:MAPEG family protein [Sinimarinibacterium sp. NLF-5-8]|uniref:MAPEG family protein n=1 Tax=Sinimarinibacterium sp. NLF-5-8 TaxID=2698684 RepID=UPI00137BA9FD|nr:MAPEG family protein [Sinimarinibacterium sp. NLF-5-8]QHS11325.1 MAPEG family protein [Sinimarinibacterium sp. NLF-5-8]
MTAMTALLGFAAWTLLLIVLVVLWRGIEILRGVPADSWTRNAEKAASPGIVTRMAHAHANALENLPIFAVIVLVAHALGKSAVVDGVAAFVLYARIAQSSAHIIAVNHWMVLVRATFYFIQVALFAYLLWSLLA